MKTHMIWLGLLALIFFTSGVLHFLKPTPFLKIMPRWVPFPKWANYLTGALEILFAVALLYTKTREAAAWGIIALLIAVFPANWRHYQLTKGTKFETMTLLRLPLQLFLIWWAFQYT